MSALRFSPMTPVYQPTTLCVGSSLPEVLLAMRRSRIHLGLVVEDGRSIGVVSLDRVLAELVSADNRSDAGS